MKRARVILLWLYRREIISLIYLLMLVVAFTAIWKFRGSSDETVADSLAFEENHKVIDVVISDKRQPVDAMEIPVDKTDKIEQPWQSNAARVAVNSDDKPQIAIIIDDLGVVRDKTLAMINSRAPLTLSFLPYAPDLPELTGLARRRGHELMVHLPMEPKGDKDPGPHALLTSESDGKISQNLAFDLAQFSGYVGVNNHMGSAFTEDRQGLNILLNEMHKRGLLVLDSRTTSKSLLAAMATARHIPNMTRDIFLDNRQDVSYILGQLQKLEHMAIRRGNAIAIGHPYAETIQALSLWLPTLKQKGIAIVPLSHLVKRKYDRILLAKAKAVASSTN